MRDFRWLFLFLKCNLSAVWVGTRTISIQEDGENNQELIWQTDRQTNEDIERGRERCLMLTRMSSSCQCVVTFSISSNPFFRMKIEWEWEMGFGILERIKNEEIIDWQLPYNQWFFISSDKFIFLRFLSKLILVIPNSHFFF